MEAWKVEEKEASSKSAAAGEILWKLIVLTCAVATFVVIGRIVWNFTHNPTVTSISYETRRSVIPPEVMICPRWLVSLKKLNASNSPEAAEIRKIITKLGFDPLAIHDEDFLTNMTVATQIQGYLQGLQKKTVGEVQAILRSFGPDCEDLFKDPCYIGRDEVRCCDHVDSLFESYGSACYHFRHNDTYKTLTDSSAVFIFDANYLKEGVIHTMQAFPGATFTFNVQPRIYPTVNFNELPAVLGNTYKLLLEETVYEQKNNMFQRKCDERKADGIRESDCNEYYTELCFFLKNNCSRVLSDLYPRDFGDMESAIGAFEKTQYCGSLPPEEVEVDSSKCLPSCKIGNYRLTQASIPVNNSVTLEVRLSSFGLLASRQVDQLTLDSVIGNVGGAMGFFLGASLLTLCDLLRSIPFRSLPLKAVKRRLSTISISDSKIFKRNSAPDITVELKKNLEKSPPATAYVERVDADKIIK